MKRISFLLLFVVVQLCSKAIAQTPDTLSKSLAAVALNHDYPLPADVLNLEKELQLTAQQIAKLKKVAATLNLKQTEVAVSTAQNEKTLTGLFNSGKVNEGVIIFYTNRYGLYQGELRGALLIACYETRQILSLGQLNKFTALQNHY